jgi:hypothetical protein
MIALGKKCRKLASESQSNREELNFAGKLP